MNSNKEDLEKMIEEIDEFNKSVNSPSYWTTGKQTLPIKNFGKSKMGLIVVGSLGILFSIIILIIMGSSGNIDASNVFSLIPVLLFSVLFFIKGIKISK
ncbi:hypothetical protein [Clostridium sp. 'White wine YQ']|uniref:hypothetical protein n=1 Tax=Clostridium sp. 'White wine YQ' TaxID=3027474 RepID=UPI0023669694|nr:hypothetical protein [Clostridium sp. 'White wine YQ']MDD7794812.1 hypothetical protein [Clostridium sp. 'White wine YQ']